MVVYSYLTDLAYAYLGLLIAFSIAQLMLWRPSTRTHISFWVLASLFSAIGTAFAPHLLTVVSVEDFGVWGGLAALLGGVLRFLALSFRKKSFDRNRLAWFFFWLTLIVMPLAAVSPLEKYRLFFSSIVGASISAACFLAMFGNRIWRSRFRFPLFVTMTGMGLSFLALIARALTSYPIGSDQIFVGDSPLQRLALETLVLISFFLQVGFTGMLVTRRDQEEMFADRRAVRVAQRTIRLNKRGHELEQTSRERLDLIQLLTHEVRQPISNAQASLQSISFYLRSTKNTSPKAKLALKRAQAALDSITLALSNIIVASTLVSNESKWIPQEFEASAILEMAKLDCRPEDHDRIVTRATDQNIYLFGVPILLRVALQNLFDHALRLSVPQREILAELSIDPDSQMVVFDIRIISDKLDVLTNDVFERRRSSDTERLAVSSLGLFVVRQVAREFSGEVRLSINQSGCLSFKLLLPY